MHTLTACIASNAAQRAHQHAAFEKDMRDWRRWRRTTLACHEVAEVGGRLFHPRGDGRYVRQRAVRGRPGIACHGAFAQSYGLGREVARRP